MKVLISLFQVFVMVLVVLFSIGAIEVVSYRTFNEPLRKSIRQSFSFRREVALSSDLFHFQHWTIRYTRPYWLTPKG